MKINEINEKFLVPHDCYVILTEKCNLRCKHCYGSFGEETSKELNGKEWNLVIKDLKSEGVFYLNISGGEPTMHPDFIEIVDSLIKNEMYFIITTNGVFNDEILNKILSAKEYLIGIKISLDGFDYDSHGYLRRNINGKMNKEIFNKTLNTIKTISKEDIPLTIATCLHKKNIENFDKLKKLILEIRPNSWFISTISTNGRSALNKDIYASDKLIDKKYWTKLKRELLRKNIYVNYIDMDYANSTKLDSNFYYSCPAAKTFCEISSEGLVSPCPLARVNIPKNIIKFDNIKEKKLKDIWNGEAFNKFRYYMTHGCDGCKCKDKCDRCVPQSLEWFDDPCAPTPFCVKNGNSLGIKNNEKWERILKEKEKEFRR